MMHYMEQTSTPEVAHMAMEVRRQRQLRAWSLDEAATRIGISRRLLAQIEAGQANPSLSTLLSIADGFDIALVDLIEVPNKAALTLQDDNSTAPIFWTGDQGGVARLLVGSGPLELWEWTLMPGDERHSEAHRANAREAILVTEGTVTLTIGAGERAEVTTGQSALFHSDVAHSYANERSEPARFFLSVHEPIGAPR